MRQLLFFLMVICLADAQSSCGDERFAKWQRIELGFNGPNSSIEKRSPNPFSVKLDVVFTSPAGKVFRVPGFYDGDGKGGFRGSIWKVRFSGDEVGVWTYKSISDNKVLDGRTGRFQVTKPEPGVKGFWKWGRLEAVGTKENGLRYFKFRDGPYWLKAGCDDPENFLGKYRNFNTTEKRLAAIDYLASKGINSLYIMTHNIRGDDRDVWPWMGETEKEAMSNGGADAYFDVAKLEQWRQLFEHMQTRGVVPYLILEDDSAWKGYDHDRYWREMIARFGYLPAVVFNLGEEHNENYRLRDGLELARKFRLQDPYAHPLGIHNVNRPNDAYIDSDVLDMTAIQTGSPGSRRGLKDAVQHNRICVDWIRRCKRRGQRVLMVNFDEGRPEMDRRAWWSAYLGGGVWEAHVLQPYDRSHKTWDKVWTELGGARKFMESLPFDEMEPTNELVRKGKAFCLAKSGATYALYLPQGGVATLALPKGQRFRVQWWNPANGFGGEFERQQMIDGGLQELSAPASGDWAVRIVRIAR